MIVFSFNFFQKNLTRRFYLKRSLSHQVQICEVNFQVFCEGENWNSSVPTCLVPPATPQLDLPELVLYHLGHSCSDDGYDVDGGNGVGCL